MFREVKEEVEKDKKMVIKVEAVVEEEEEGVMKEKEVVVVGEYGDEGERGRRRSIR